MTRSIGGKLDLEALAMLYGKPACDPPAPLPQATVRRLARQGMKPRKIAKRTGLPVSAVRSALDGRT